MGDQAELRRHHCYGRLLVRLCREMQHNPELPPSIKQDGLRRSLLVLESRKNDFSRNPNNNRLQFPVHYHGGAITKYILGFAKMLQVGVICAAFRFSPWQETLPLLAISQ